MRHVLWSSPSQLRPRARSYGMQPARHASKLIIMGIAVALCLPSASAVAATLSGIIHHWTANADALDSVGTNNGTLVGGATFGAGYDGMAFDFTGAGDYVSMA